MSRLQTYPVNFKEVFTIKTLQFQINPFITLTKMIELLIPLLSTQFGINENEIEIVEAGRNENGGLSEAAPAIEPSNKKLCDIWGEDLSNVSFYVRRKNHVYPQIHRWRTERE